MIMEPFKREFCFCSSENVLTTELNGISDEEAGLSSAKNSRDVALSRTFPQANEYVQIDRL
jgi:hypothetical protein